ncbi:Protein kinase [Elasticomyces elasticus]|nr:Protein kinase [Elasticomyces elasticus]
MSSTIDDEDLSLSISTSNTRRNSKDTRSGPSVPAPRPAHPPVQRTTQRLGQYNVVKTLGEGSFGKVKLAIHQVSGQKVALKIISRRKLVTRDMAGRIEREIQYLQLLRHPHIIKLYTVITTPNEIIMVLEYAGGELFDYIVANGKMTEDKARKFFQQIVCAVEYCHRHKIVHRDLKPENLLLDEQLNVKIADFGLSNIMTDGNFLKTSCGSPNYAAPEVISGKLYAGPEVDVWSCGVILYVLLVGRLPFDDEYIPTLFKKIAQGNYMVPNYLSSGAVRLIRRMLQVNPVNRISVQEIRQDPWFTKDLAEYLQPPVEEFLDTGVDPNKAIDPRRLAPSQPAPVQERLHESVVGKLGTTMGYGRDDVQEALAKDEPSAIKDAYLIVRENTIMKANPSLSKEPTLSPFLAQSPPAFNHSMPSPPPVRPPTSPLGKIDHPRHGSIGSTGTIETRSPASHIAVLPSSLPDYHRAYMEGQPKPGQGAETGSDSFASASESREQTRDEQVVTARRLKPHSRSQANISRNRVQEEQAMKPESMTPIPSKEIKKPRPTRWQFGIRSRNSPADAMLAIYKALKALGAVWEVPRTREPGGSADRSGNNSPSRHRDREGSQSPEYSDSDPEAGTDPEYSTHEERERRQRRSSGHGSPHSASSSEGDGPDPHSRSRRRKRRERGRGRERFGHWNNWGYSLPEDPWVINARFNKEGMFPPGVAHPSSTHSSRVDLRNSSSTSLEPMQRRRSSTVGSAGPDGTGGQDASAENAAATGPGGEEPRNAECSAADESVWVYVTIQLYCIEKEFFLVDFKCAGYERLVPRRAPHRMGKQTSAPDGASGGKVDGRNGDVEHHGTRREAGAETYEDGEHEGEEQEYVGAGRSTEEKEISSPFPFLDVASRLIIQLAEAG